MERKPLWKVFLNMVSLVRVNLPWNVLTQLSRGTLNSGPAFQTRLHEPNISFTILLGLSRIPTSFIQRHFCPLRFVFPQFEIMTAFLGNQSMQFVAHSCLLVPTTFFLAFSVFNSTWILWERLYDTGKATAKWEGDGKMSHEPRNSPDIRGNGFRRLGKGSNQKLMSETLLMSQICRSCFYFDERLF